MEAAHAYPRPEEPATGDIDVVDQRPKFHIITFNPFYISCVHTKKQDDCPGFELALEVNSEIKDNTKALEGFFLKNVDLPLDLETHCNVNLGNCVVSLTR